MRLSSSVGSPLDVVNLHTQHTTLTRKSKKRVRLYMCCVWYGFVYSSSKIPSFLSNSVHSSGEPIRISNRVPLYSASITAWRYFVAVE
jgi:hypothetical protein